MEKKVYTRRVYICFDFEYSQFHNNSEQENTSERECVERREGAVKGIDINLAKERNRERSIYS